MNEELENWWYMNDDYSELVAINTADTDSTGYIVDINNTVSYPYSFSEMLERNLDLNIKRQEFLTNLDELRMLLESDRGDIRNIKEQLDKFDVSWCEFKLLVDGTDI